MRDAAGRWHTASRTRGFPRPYPLFNLPALLARPMAPVLICEGEQAAEAASRQFPDWVAVTSLHGAKAPQKSDWSSVARRDVTIWPDADDAGARFAVAVAAARARGRGGVCADRAGAERCAGGLGSGGPVARGDGDGCAAGQCPEAGDRRR